MSVAEGIARCGGRRFFLTIGAGIVNTLLLMAGYIGEDTYQVLTLGTVAAYIAGGTAQKFVKP